MTISSASLRGRVVGAGRAAVAGLGDDQRARREHGRQAAQVAAEQAAQRPHPVGQFRVVVAGRVQGGSVIGRAVHGLADRAGVASHVLASHVEEVVAAPAACLRRSASGSSGSSLPIRPEVGLVDPQAGELQQALVDVADLLDVQALVGQPLGRAAAALQDEQRAEHLVRPPGR